MTTATSGLAWARRPLLLLALLATGCPADLGGATASEGAPVASAGAPAAIASADPDGWTAGPRAGWPVVPLASTEAPPARAGDGAVRLVIGPGGGLRAPRAAAFGPGGDLFLVDRAGRLLRLDARGRLVAAAPLPRIDKGTPTGLAWSAASGELLVADSHEGRVLVYGGDLTLRRSWGQVGREPGRLMIVTGVAVDPGGDVWLTDEGEDVARLQRFAPDGALRRAFGSWGRRPGELRRPAGVALDPPRRRLALGDAQNHRVQVWSDDGQVLHVLGQLGEGPGELKYPHGVAFDGDGRLFVADLGNARLCAWSADGAWLGAWSAPGRAPGQLSFPWGLAVGGGLAAVCDAGNDRVQVVDLAVAFGGSR